MLPFLMFFCTYFVSKALFRKNDSNLDFGFAFLMSSFDIAL